MAGNALAANVYLVDAAMDHRGVFTAEVASAACSLRLGRSGARTRRVLQRARLDVQSACDPHCPEGQRQHSSAPDTLIFVGEPRGQETQAEQHDERSDHDEERTQFVSHSDAVQKTEIPRVCRRRTLSEDIGSGG